MGCASRRACHGGLPRALQGKAPVRGQDVVGEIDLRPGRQGQQVFPAEETVLGTEPRPQEIGHYFEVAAKRKR